MTLKERFVKFGMQTREKIASIFILIILFYLADLALFGLSSIIFKIIAVQNLATAAIAEIFSCLLAFVFLLALVLLYDGKLDAANLKAAAKKYYGLLIALIVFSLLGTVLNIYQQEIAANFSQFFVNFIYLAVPLLYLFVPPVFFIIYKSKDNFVLSFSQNVFVIFAYVLFYFCVTYCVSILGEDFIIKLGGTDIEKIANLFVIYSFASILFFYIIKAFLGFFVLSLVKTPKED